MKASCTLLLALSAIMFSCSSNVDLAIDNPTNEAIIVSIDSLVVEVPAREVVWVEMGKGEHQIKFNDDSVVNYDFTQEMYMLNPTLTEYLKFEQFYGNEAFLNSHQSSITHKKIVYMGMDIEGEYDVVQGLVNPITWDYGPREALPEVVEIDSDEMYAAVIKISDPIELMEEVMASEGDAVEGAEVVTDEEALIQ